MVQTFERRRMAVCFLNRGGAAQTNQAVAPKQTAGKIRIGFSMDTLKEEHWQRDKDLIESRTA